MIRLQEKESIFGTPTAGLTWKPAILFFRICRLIQRKLLWSACLRLSGSALIDRAPSRCSVYALTRRCRGGSKNWPTNAPKVGSRLRSVTSMKQ